MKTNNALKFKELPKILSSTQTAGELKDIIVKILDDGKALNISEISLKGKTTIADFLIVASGTSDRHLFALATKICDELAQKGMKGLHVEGERGSEWLLIDANDVIVHLFKPEVRATYDLETMWSGDFERLLSQAKAARGS